MNNLKEVHDKEYTAGTKFGHQQMGNPKPNVCTANDNNGDGLLKNISRDIENSNDDLFAIVYKLRNLYERIFDPNSDSKELTNFNKDLVPSYSLEYELKIMLDKNAELRSEIFTLCGILESKL